MNNLRIRGWPKNKNCSNNSSRKLTCRAVLDRLVTKFKMLVQKVVRFIRVEKTFKQKHTNPCFMQHRIVPLELSYILNGWVQGSTGWNYRHSEPKVPEVTFKWYC